MTGETHETFAIFVGAHVIGAFIAGKYRGRALYRYFYVQEAVLRKPICVTRTASSKDFIPRRGMSTILL